MLLRLLRTTTTTPSQTLTLTHLLLRSLHGPSPEPPDPSSFTVSYLSSACGLAPGAAAAAAASVRLSSAAGPDAVLAVLRGYGFSDPQIASLVSKHPRLLLSHPDRTVRRKLDSLLAFGLPRPDLLSLLAKSPALLNVSLEKRLLPNLALLLAALGSSRLVMAALRGSSRLLGYDLAKVMSPNLETLRSHGVPPTKIAFLATRFPWIITQRPDRFAEAVESLTKLNINPSSTSFVLAVNAMAGLTRPTWHRKLALYRTLGWSDEQTLAAFALHPNCMLASDEKIARAMGFFRAELRFDPAFLARRPKLIALSLENRILPRCAVLELLLSKGALRTKRRRLALHTVLLMTEKKFAERFVAGCQQEVPEVAEAYQSKIRSSASEQQSLERPGSHSPLVEFFSSPPAANVAAVFSCDD